MQGVYGKLAVDRCGSHIIEKCYKAADVNVKVRTLRRAHLCSIPANKGRPWLT
jgi:hypothetical protein